MFWYPHFIIDMSMSVVTVGSLLLLRNQRVSPPHQAFRKCPLSCLPSFQFCPVSTDPVLSILNHLYISNKVKLNLLETFLRDVMINILMRQLAESVRLDPAWLALTYQATS